MVGVPTAAACADSNDTEPRLRPLKTKANRALQSSAAAKVDATTALEVSLKDH